MFQPLLFSKQYYIHIHMSYTLSEVSKKWLCREFDMQGVIKRKYSETILFHLVYILFIIINKF